jgi:hypothetical protein
MNPQIRQLIEQQICQPLVGLIVPTNQGGKAGRHVELILRNMGVPIQPGEGADFTLVLNLFNITYYVEVKTRDVSATSPHTIGTIHPSKVANTLYEDSSIWQKLQYQIRVTTENFKIIKAELFDFTVPHIQQKFKEAFIHGKDQIVSNTDVSCTHVDGHWGYFEKCNSRSDSFYFRLSKDDMPAIERMSRSTYQNLFEETI